MFILFSVIVILLEQIIYWLLIKYDSPKYSPPFNEYWTHCNNYKTLDLYISSEYFQKRSNKYKSSFLYHLNRVRKNGMFLNGVGGFIQNKFIVLEAVSNNGLSIRWMSMNFNNDKDIIETAVKQNSEAMVYINDTNADISKDIQFLVYLTINCG